MQYIIFIDICNQRQTQERRKFTRPWVIRRGGFLRAKGVVKQCACAETPKSNSRATRFRAPIHHPNCNRVTSTSRSHPPVDIRVSPLPLTFHLCRLSLISQCRQRPTLSTLGVSPRENPVIIFSQFHKCHMSNKSMSYCHISALHTLTEIYYWL